MPEGAGPGVGEVRRDLEYPVMTLVSAGWLVPQLGDVLVPLPGREATGYSANPPDGVLDVQVPEPGRAVVAAAGQCVPVGAERHRVHGGGAAGQGLAERAGVRGIGDIPQPDRAVGVARWPACALSGLNATESTSAAPPVRGWPSGRGCAGSATSPQPDHAVDRRSLASVCPSGLNATERMLARCRWSGPGRAGGVRGIGDTPTPRPRRRSLPPASVCPSGLNATEKTGAPVWSGGWPTGPGVRGIGDIPQPDRRVVAAAGQRVPVRAERHRPHGRLAAAGQGGPSGLGCAGSATSHSRIVPSSCRRPACARRG